ncbi:hypothetical protein ACFP51_12755 [Streptomyces pratens]|uniref:Uncharacterized protein n=1 Tax=Streptomyces pratens TaxID=887456 RepID=A0ABW1M1X9_9ACTN
MTKRLVLGVRTVAAAFTTALAGPVTGSLANAHATRTTAGDRWPVVVVDTSWGG